LRDDDEDIEDVMRDVVSQKFSPYTVNTLIRSENAMDALKRAQRPLAR
jgi:hypothetical protein